MLDGGNVSDVAEQLAKATEQIAKRPAPKGSDSEDIDQIDTVNDGNVTTALNEELIPVIKELRTKANLRLNEEATATTLGDGVYTEVWRSPVLETNGVYGLHADVKWTSADLSVWARIQISNSISSQAGVVSLVMVDAGEIHYSTVGLFAQWQADSANRQVVLQVRDDGVNPMIAKAHVTMGAVEK